MAPFGAKTLLAACLAVMLISSVKSLGHADRAVMDLSGQWMLQPGDAMPSTFNYSVPVPGLVDLAAPHLDLKNNKYFWYKKEFTIAREMKGKHAFIKMDQSQFGAEVFLNGKSLGSYYGCYTSHEYDATQVLKYGGKNVLIVKVGSKETLPDGASAVGIDWERVSWLPGIWGDVRIYFTGDIKIDTVQLLPNLSDKSTCVRTTLRNLGDARAKGTVMVGVAEKKSGKISGTGAFEYDLEAGAEKVIGKDIEIQYMKLWSPDTPFLYDVSVKAGGFDSYLTTFGMREFRVQGKHFYLNGKRIVLKGSNIAFHRFLSDSDRKGLVWDPVWIKKALIDIPKANNFNFFRNHIGQMYNKWYDIADEGGIMLQNEWPFWGWPVGDKDVIRAEFTQWMKDNYNHPSIIIWDCANESNYDKPDRLSMIDFVRHDIVSEMKKLDPTRPWEPTDFEEIHPYIYSFHSVLGIQGTGGLSFIPNIVKSKTPVALNEYPWFWIDKNGQPSNLTIEVAPKWLGKNASISQLLEFQAFLAQELTELWRRLDADEIAPFVYISINEGATSHWFKSDIKGLEQKPIIAALKNVFSPLFASIELWDRHFYADEKRAVQVYLLNDTDKEKSCAFSLKIVDNAGNPVSTVKTEAVKLPASGRQVITADIVLPSRPGTYYLEARMNEAGVENNTALSRKILHVFNEPSPGAEALKLNIAVIDPKGAVKAYLDSKGFKVNDFNPSSLSKQDFVIAAEGSLNGALYRENIDRISDFVKSGKTLLILTPEEGVKDKEYVDICDEISLTIQRQSWRGGESYVFFEDPSAPLWDKLDQEHMKIFNGGWGGEIVSGYDVTAPLPNRPAAVCGMGLKMPALIEMPSGKGLVAVSRMAVSGRLVSSSDGQNGLYGLRRDPVVQQHLLNLLSAYTPGSKYFQAVHKQLGEKSFSIRKADASSYEGNNLPYSAIDGDPKTRWSSQFSDSQWITFDTGKTKDLYGIKLVWETACAKEYELQVSGDLKQWQSVFYTRSSKGGNEFIKFSSVVKGRYVRLNGLKRATDWGYSLWEAQVYTNEKDLPAETTLASEKISAPVKPAGISVSSVEKDECRGEFAVDGDIGTRWSSRSDGDEQWLSLDLGKPQKISTIKLNWENAFALEYALQVSDDGEKWKTIFKESAGKGGNEEIILKKPAKYRYLRILCLKRATPYGYSLWEIQAFN